MTVELFTMTGCRECDLAKKHCAERFECRFINCDRGEEKGIAYALGMGISHVPTAIFYDDEGKEFARAFSLSEIMKLEEQGLLQSEEQS